MTERETNDLFPRNEGNNTDENRSEFYNEVKPSSIKHTSEYETGKQNKKNHIQHLYVKNVWNFL